MPHELRDYQREAVQSLFDYFTGGEEGNPLVVAPTGAGKSLIIADFCKNALMNWPKINIVVIAHRKELLEQNAQELWEQWPSAPIGIYSAGLRMKQLSKPLTIAGIGSLYRAAHKLGKIDILIIDEAHLLPPKGLGMYRSLIASLREKNPHLKVVGLTATPFRLDQGFLHEGDDRIFTDITYNIDVRMLIELGHLSPLIGKGAVNSADLSDVRIRGGEFVESDLQEAFGTERLVREAVSEMIRFGQDRRSWLVFSSGVDHGYAVSGELNRQGIQAQLVVGDSNDDHRKTVVRDFREGRLRALVNCGVFTTGFNARNVDMIALLRATQSTSLYCQIMGRGMRTSPETGKTNCLVLDYGGNIERHGPVDEIKIISKRTREGGEKLELSLAPMKVCPECREMIPLACTECRVCGHIMERSEALHEPEASEASPMASDDPDEMIVREVIYSLHEKEGSPDSMKVTYFDNYGAYASEWWCFNHTKANAVNTARNNWVKAIRPEFFNVPIPSTTEEALERAMYELVSPLRIWTKKEGKFYRIISKVYPSIEELRAIDENEILF